MKYLFRNTDHRGNMISIELEEESLDEVVAHFRQFLLGVGFSPSNVDEYLPPT